MLHKLVLGEITLYIVLYLLLYSWVFFFFRYSLSMVSDTDFPFSVTTYTYFLKTYLNKDIISFKEILIIIHIVYKYATETK